MLLCFQSLEDEEKQLKAQLIKLKNYDDQLQIKDEELSKQRLLYEKEEVNITQL